MTVPNHPKSFPSLTFTIRAKANHPKLLEGLDVWVQLGLVSDQWVREACRQQLSCPVSFPELLSVSSQPSAERSTPSVVVNAQSRSTFAQSVSPQPSSSLPVPLIPRLTQAVLDNFSITWLLFLGVFLVVLSSVVLAASKWQSVSPPGQYSILFVYTLAFWGVGSWTQRQASLQITSWMLRVATVLIIPINFWMIDGLGLWDSLWGWVMGMVAAIALSAMILALVHTKSSASFLAAVNTIALSGLHWGWDVDPMPLFATYLGTVGTALWVSRYQTAYLGGGKDSSQSKALGELSTSTSQVDAMDADRGPFPLGLIAIAFATFLLVIRAVTVGQVPWSQLGLAIGLCGWVLSWISRPSAQPNAQTYPNRDLWLKGGAKLLLLGWLVSVGVDPPWQALIVSGLGFWLLGDRLLRYWRSIDLIALLIVGLQLLWLVERLVPGVWRSYVLDLCIRISGPQGMPTALMGLTLFPYVLVILAVGRYLRHRQKQRLGQQADWLALGLGSCLTVVSLLNPMTRSLNLLASTVTIGAVGRQACYRQSSQSLVWAYWIHGLIVATLLSWMEVLIPSLTPIQWAISLVGLTGMEWGLYSHLTPSPVRKTTWTIGLGLGAIAYSLFLTDSYNTWCIVWLLVPLMLIYVGHRSLKLRPIVAQAVSSPSPQPATTTPVPNSDWVSPPLAGWLSTLALFLGQPFLFNISGLEGWVLGFNAFTLLLSVPLTRSLWTASFSTGCAVLSLWTTTYQMGLVTDVQPLYLWALTPGLLWLLRSALHSHSSLMATLYRRASNGWAIAITIVLLLLGTIYTLLIALSLLGATGDVSDAAIATSLLLVSLLYRLWTRTSLSRWGREWTYLGIAWAIGLLTAQLNSSFNGTVTTLAIAFLSLGLITQLLLCQPSSRPISPFIPLLYGILGWSLSQIPFTASTGLYTLTFAIIAIGVGRRRPRLKALIILAVGLSTMAAYQLLIYQMQQASGGKSGDGLMLLAGLGLMLTVLYGLGAWGQMKPWFQSYLKLGVNDLRPIGHCHWVLANSLGGLAMVSPRGFLGHGLGAITFLGLAAYALAWGHQRSPLPLSVKSKGSPSTQASQSLHRSQASTPSNFAATKGDQGWTIVGIWQLIGAIAFSLYSFAPNPSVVTAWGGAIASCVAFLLYVLPWHRWGWPLSPWFQSALVLPSIVMLLTANETTIPSILIVAAFYVWFAKATDRIRISYLSIGFISWALLWFLALQQWTQVLWVSVDVGGALLYIVEVDPALRRYADGTRPSDRLTSNHQDREEAIAPGARTSGYSTPKQTRHILRTLATGLICLSSVYQSESTAWAVLFTVGFSLALIAVGIGLKTRAYLFVGTGTLLFEVIRYTLQFIGQHPFQIWAVGIFLGLALIWVAATFEARRHQVQLVFNYWTTELKSWE